MADLYASLGPGIEALRNFQFHADNPLFWGVITVLFLLLVRIWTAKRTFWFCVVAAVILLAMTMAETHMLHEFSAAGEGFDPGVIRLAGLSLLTFIFLVTMFLN